MPEPAVEIHRVSVSFPRPRGRHDDVVPALRDVTIDVMTGEFVCIVGPSGCGKTTLLRLIAGLLSPDTGLLRLEGRPNPPPGPHVGFVFQSFRLLPWRTVAANVEFPLQLQAMPASERHARARLYLRLVGLDDFATSYPHELSGGMQQRVALARALALEPRILLMDEPFAALDAQTREFMQLELSRIWQKLGMAVVFVTHSLDEALLLADRVMLMGPRPGTMLDVLPVPLPRPRWEYDARATRAFVELRAYLGQRIREMVSEEPEFRQLGADPRASALGR
jgi:NitT/TauT family transport system ATP-binding protein